MYPISGKSILVYFILGIYGCGQNGAQQLGGAHDLRKSPANEGNIEIKQKVESVELEQSSDNQDKELEENVVAQKPVIMSGAYIASCIYQDHTPSEGLFLVTCSLPGSYENKKAGYIDIRGNIYKIESTIYSSASTEIILHMSHEQIKVIIEDESIEVSKKIYPEGAVLSSISQLAEGVEKKEDVDASDDSVRMVEDEKLNEDEIIIASVEPDVALDSNVDMMDLVNEGDVVMQQFQEPQAVSLAEDETSEVVTQESRSVEMQVVPLREFSVQKSAIMGKGIHFYSSTEPIVVTSAAKGSVKYKSEVDKEGLVSFKITYKSNKNLQNDDSDYFEYRTSEGLFKVTINIVYPLIAEDQFNRSEWKSDLWTDAEAWLNGLLMYDHSPDRQGVLLMNGDYNSSDRDDVRIISRGLDVSRYSIVKAYFDYMLLDLGDTASDFIDQTEGFNMKVCLFDTKKACGIEPRDSNKLSDESIWKNHFSIKEDEKNNDLRDSFADNFVEATVSIDVEKLERDNEEFNPANIYLMIEAAKLHMGVRDLDSLAGNCVDNVSLDNFILNGYKLKE